MIAVRSIGSAASCASIVSSVPAVRARPARRRERRSPPGNHRHNTASTRRPRDRWRGWQDEWPAWRLCGRSRPASRRAAFLKRGRKCGSAPGSVRLREWSVRGAVLRLRQRRRARPASAYKGCRAFPAAGSARQRRSRSRGRRSASARRHGRARGPRRTRPRSRRATAARCRSASSRRQCCSRRDDRTGIKADRQLANTSRRAA